MTRAERLDALVRKAAPKAMKFFDEHKVWPLEEELQREDGALVFAEDGQNKRDDKRRQAPYAIHTLNGDRRRISITSDDGDVVSANGSNMDSALDALEARLG